MKSILISIKPTYVAKILNGEKTIEIRKTTPKCDLPVDVYIYCTKDKKYPLVLGYNGEEKYYCNVFDSFYVIGHVLNGKVVAKFTLNKMEEIKRSGENMFSIYHTDCYNSKRLQIQSCLDLSEIYSYLKGDIGYAWHISNLVIFDKPKELSDFYPYCKDEKCEHRKNHCSICYRPPLTKAPQSYMFIEVE